MNKEWAELNRTMQAQIKRKETYEDGIETLFCLRNQLMKTLLLLHEELKRDDFNAIPFINADGYHNKTIAYSIWHIFRIEDIVAHTLINNDEQIFFSKNYKERMNAPVITTGNELDSEKIVAFSKKIDVDELLLYAKAVMESTHAFLPKLSYDDMKRKFTDADKERLVDSKCVSTDENAVWLIDYWCSKDVRGLLKMPFSRHWIMHIEAMLRIKNQLCKIVRDN